MPVYHRPMFDLVCGSAKPSLAPEYPYSPAMLRRYDVFDLFLLDGGAFFYTRERLGGHETRRWLGAFRSGKLLSPWRRSPRRPVSPDNIDWLAAYDESKARYSPSQLIEKHDWLNRLFFLLPLAQAFLRTGQRKWAESWFAYLESWVVSFPPPEDWTPDKLSPAQRDPCEDMQIAWRVLALIHSVAMFAGRPEVFTAAQWAFIYGTLKRQAGVVCAEARQQLPKEKGGWCPRNHFLQKGTALLAAGVLYPEFCRAAEWVDTGRQVVREHLRLHTYRDGGSVEACPSYSHFIARLYLDAHLLLEANGRKGVPGLRRSIAAQYDFLARTASPEGRSLQLSDSFSLDVRLDREIVSRVFSLPPLRPPRPAVFRHSQFAVLRDGKTVVYVDAMPGGLWHIHRGKPNLLVYHGDRPVLVDSGCVSYDRPWERDGYLKRREAHNVVVVEPVKEDEFPGTSTTYELGPLREGGRSVTAVCRHTGEGTRYTWRRLVRLRDGVVEIEDRVRTGKRVRCTLHLHLAPCRTSKRAGGITARGPWGTLSCCSEDGRGRKLAPGVRRRLAMDDRNGRCQSPDVTFKQSGRSVTFKTVLHIEGR